MFIVRRPASSELMHRLVFIAFKSELGHSRAWHGMYTQLPGLYSNLHTTRENELIRRGTKKCTLIIWCQVTLANYTRTQLRGGVFGGVNEWTCKLLHADPMNRDRTRRETHLLFYAHMRFVPLTCLSFMAICVFVRHWLRE